MEINNEQQKNTTFANINRKYKNLMKRYEVYRKELMAKTEYLTADYEFLTEFRLKLLTYGEKFTNYEYNIDVNEKELYHLIQLQKLNCQLLYQINRDCNMVKKKINKPSQMLGV